MQKLRFYTRSVQALIFASLSVVFSIQPLHGALQSGSNPDFDGSGVVDFPDFLQFADKFGFSRGDAAYEVRYDLNGDGEIAFNDFLLFVEHFGKAVFVDDTEDIVRPTGELKPWDLSSIVSVESVRAMPTGTPVFMRTEFANGQLADLEMTFIQVVDDFLPPMPVYMVEASDPVLIQLGGIAQGMSGSPIFTEQGTWGAIAYGFSEQDSPPYYFFATPIEWVIGERGAIPLAKRTAIWQGSGISPLIIPLLGTGFNRTLQPDDSSFLSGLMLAGKTQQHQDSFAAGRPLAVGLMLGEITLAGLGTISYVDGNRIYGFGHPMFGVGAVKLPIIEAVVLGPISNLSAPFKFATLNPTVRGTLTEDRLPAVRGVLGEGPELIPVRSVYTFSSGNVLELRHRFANHAPLLSVAAVTQAFFGPLANRVEDEPNHSLRVRTDISFTETDSILARSRLYVTPRGNLKFLIDIAAGDLSDILFRLLTRDDYAVQMREAEIHIDLLPESRFGKIVAVDADTVISAGSRLSIRTSLRVGVREDREIELALSIPDPFPVGVYQLEVGSVATLGETAGDTGFDLFGVPGLVGPEDEKETLDDIIARANRRDEHVFLTARLTPSSAGPPPNGQPPDFPPTAGPSSNDQPPDFPFPGGQNTDAIISTEKEVDLFIQGSQMLRIRVVGN